MLEAHLDDFMALVYDPGACPSGRLLCYQRVWLWVLDLPLCTLERSFSFFNHGIGIVIPVLPPQRDVQRVARGPEHDRVWEAGVDRSAVHNHVTGRCSH